MRVTVEGPPSYAGIENYERHPSIVNAIKNLTQQGMNMEYIMRVVGAPAEIIRRIQTQVEKEKQKKA